MKSRSSVAVFAFAFATLAFAARAHAFCGFFVAGSQDKLTSDASQVSLLRDGNRTVLTMSNNYKGPPEDFALVVPVPVVLHEKDVKTLPADVFAHVDSLSAPRLVEYWEQDPCYVEPQVEYESSRKYEDAPPPTASASKPRDYGVKIEAQFTVGEYQILILSAKDSGGLEAWLHANKYNIPAGAATALAPYIADKMKFFVAKVDIKKAHKDEHGAFVLSPLRFGYPSDELRLPVRLGLLNAQGKQDLIIYVLHPTSRFEAANYKNAFIPTNIDVDDRVRKEFAPFYARLFDAVTAKYQNKVVVTEYAWQTNGCDPCPSPPLSLADLATLGYDAVAGKTVSSDVWGGGAAAWVLTRMHVRYDAKTLTEDLVFKEAKPVMGGRSGGDGQSVDHGATVEKGGVNNFQGRYIIRHYWTGPVMCSQPRYGRWGGPPGGGSNEPVAAKGVAAAPRDAVSLEKVVRSPVPELGLAGKVEPKR